VIGSEPAISADDVATWLRMLRWSIWILTACFVAAGILLFLIEFDVIHGPGTPPGTPNDYPIHLSYFFADQRVVFPYEVAGSTLFAIGFLAFAGVGLGLRRLSGSRDPIGTLVAACFGFAGGIGAISQLIFVGAKRVAIDPAVCECKYAPEQLISQDRALEMILGATDWLLAGALLLAALGLLAIPSLASRSNLLSTGWARASQVLAIVLFVGILGLLFEAEIVFDLFAAVGSVVLLPVWALWLDRQLVRTSPPATT
jgi:hypothetical protein